MASPIINTEGVCFKYQDEWILEGVSFKVVKNEWVGLIGPNGGGKTTLLKLLMGFYKPSCGLIKIEGQEPMLARSIMSFVPQKLDLDPLFPISLYEVVLMGRLRNLSRWGRYKKYDQEVALHALHEVGLSHKKDEAFGNLSGGEMQRGLLARAFAGEPSLLFLDEATANLDPYREQEVLEILHKKKGVMTVVMITHDIQAAEALLDRFFFVQKNLEEIPKTALCHHTSLGLYHPSKKKERPSCHTS